MNRGSILLSRKKKFCGSLDSVHACCFPQAGAHSRNIKMNSQLRAHAYPQSEHAARPYNTPCGPIHADPRATWLPQSYQNGGSPGVPNLMKYEVGFFGLMVLTALAYRETGPRPILVQRRAWQRPFWNTNPPAASDGWCNPGRTAMPLLLWRVSNKPE